MIKALTSKVDPKAKSDMRANLAKLDGPKSDGVGTEKSEGCAVDASKAEKEKSDDEQEVLLTVDNNDSKGEPKLDDAEDGCTAETLEGCEANSDNAQELNHDGKLDGPKSDGVGTEKSEECAVDASKAEEEKLDDEQEVLLTVDC